MQIFFIFWLVSVAEQTGLSFTWSETPEDKFTREDKWSGPEFIELCFMLNSTKHDIYFAHNC